MIWELEKEKAHKTLSKIRKRQTLTGKVIGAKMTKTVKVRVVREIPHPIYKKRVKRYKSYLAHVGSISPNVGDLIAISATRPVSKLKRWQVSAILSKASNLKVD